MKTFKEYLTESKKVYSFKVKVAGELPEKFQEGLTTRLGRCGVMSVTTNHNTHPRISLRFSRTKKHGSYSV
jgi:L-2-hydroxyglutarate oxidase LhgO